MITQYRGEIVTHQSFVTTFSANLQNGHIARIHIAFV